jgi:acyl-CoA thioester hydrolase
MIKDTPQTAENKNMPDHSSHQAFELPISIAPSDIDVHGHVNNVVYVRWVQDAAVAHWRALATQEQQANVTWVVVRHEIDYKRPARPEDSIIAATWVGTATNTTFERFTEILRQKDRKVLVAARTLWCPIDVKTGRPVRVGQDIRDRFSVN